MRKPIAIDLFAGAGGLSEGFRHAGAIVAVSVEKDKHAAETQRRNHAYGKRIRTEVINEDVSRVPVARLTAALKLFECSKPDVVMGGPPCQGFSRSNMHTRNLRNPLNHLYATFLCAAKQLVPPLVIIENVANLPRFEHSILDSRIIAALRSLGYGVQREVLNAVDYGIPQKRKRVFYVGTRLSQAFDFPSPDARTTRPVTVWEAISDLSSLANGNETDEMPYGEPGPITDYQRLMRKGSSPSVRGNLVSRNGDLIMRRYRYIPQGGNWRDIPARLMQNYKDKSRCHEWIYRRLSEKEPSVTISNFRKNMLIHPREDRGLSIREAARLQSFPDTFVFTGSIGFQQQQVANAVPPLLARAIGLSVRKHLGM